MKDKIYILAAFSGIVGLAFTAFTVGRSMSTQSSPPNVQAVMAHLHQSTGSLSAERQGMAKQMLSVIEKTVDSATTVNEHDRKRKIEHAGNELNQFLESIPLATYQASGSDVEFQSYNAVQASESDVELQLNNTIFLCSESFSVAYGGQTDSANNPERVKIKIDARTYSPTPGDVIRKKQYKGKKVLQLTYRNFNRTSNQPVFKMECLN